MAPTSCPRGAEPRLSNSLIVEIATDADLTGWGEMAPLGTFYSPAFASGARAGIAEIAPHLLGCDPRGAGRLARQMDIVFKGHPYIKSALDMACCDVAARAAGVPLAIWLGGLDGETVDLYKVVTHGSADLMARTAARYAAEGFHRLQVKVGGNVHDDIERVTAVAGAVPKGTVTSVTPTPAGPHSRRGNLRMRHGASTTLSNSPAWGSMNACLSDARSTSPWC